MSWSAGSWILCSAAESLYVILVLSYVRIMIIVVRSSVKLQDAASAEAVEQEPHSTSEQNSPKPGNVPGILDRFFSIAFIPLRATPQLSFVRRYMDDSVHG